MFTYSKFIHEYTKSIYCYKEPLSTDYTVTVNGEDVPVYTCRISKYPFNRVWPGFQRPIEQSEKVSFINLVSDEALDITVNVKFPYKKAILKPYSKNIKLTEKNNSISFTLSDNGQFVLEADGYRHCLYIFNSRPISAPNPRDVTYYFGPGVHFAGKVTLNSNESVYVDKDALVFGCIFAENAENIHIYGNGILDDTSEERVCIHCYEDFTNGNIKFYSCKKICIEGVLCRNSAIWCLNFFHCFDVLVDDIKIFGQWKYNTDGIDIVNCRDVAIKNSFIHSFDDTITIKSIDRYAETDNVNIHTENCVLWCDWGKACELGIETYCREYKNISFKNCDILRAGHIAMCVDNGEDCEMSNILFEDIRVEYNQFDTPPQYQDADDTVYKYENDISIPALLVITNKRWRTEENVKLWGVPTKRQVELDFTGIEQTGIHDVTCKNISVYYDAGMPIRKDGRYHIYISSKSEVEDVIFRNISISDVFVNGIPVSTENAVIETLNTDKFILK